MTVGAAVRDPRRAARRVSRSPAASAESTRSPRRRSRVAALTGQTPVAARAWPDTGLGVFAKGVRPSARGRARARPRAFPGCRSTRPRPAGLELRSTGSAPPDRSSSPAAWRAILRIGKVTAGHPARCEQAGRVPVDRADARVLPVVPQRPFGAAEHVAQVRVAGAAAEPSRAGVVIVAPAAPRPGRAARVRGSPGRASPRRRAGRSSASASVTSPSAGREPWKPRSASWTSRRAAPAGGRVDRPSSGTVAPEAQHMSLVVMPGRAEARRSAPRPARPPRRARTPPQARAAASRRPDARARSCRQRARRRAPDGGGSAR